MIAFLQAFSFITWNASRCQRHIFQWTVCLIFFFFIFVLIYSWIFNHKNKSGLNDFIHMADIQIDWLINKVIYMCRWVYTFFFISNWFNDYLIQQPHHNRHFRLIWCNRSAIQHHRFANWNFKWNKLALHIWEKERGKQESCWYI